MIDSKLLDQTQACNISEGLKFQPGLRVETDCQTCNYTQLRMNGLGGGYSQILINGRPVFSPLTGLYGMEQIPANMVERIEVVRGGGSALYGSSAIGGTVNVITRIPKESSYDISVNTSLINGKAMCSPFAVTSPKMLASDSCASKLGAETRKARISSSRAEFLIGIDGYIECNHSCLELVHRNTKYWKGKGKIEEKGR